MSSRSRCASAEKDETRTSPVKTARLLPLLILLVCPLVLSLSYARESLAVEGTLDHGGSWDYVAGRADFSESHPFIPYAERHEFLIRISTVSALAAALYLVLFHLSRQGRHS